MVKHGGLCIDFLVIFTWLNCKLLMDSWLFVFFGLLSFLWNLF